MSSVENRIVALFFLITIPLLLWPLRRSFTLENLQSGAIVVIGIAIMMAIAVLGIMIVGQLWALVGRLWALVRPRPDPE